MRFDFTKIKFQICDKMRYDTPGDWYFDENENLIIEVWSGLRPEYQQEIFGHELQEAAILLSAGLTVEMIDIIDAWFIVSRRYAAGEMGDVALALACVEYEKVPIRLRDIYELAHNQALLWGRTFLNACGLDWYKEEQELNDLRGKIPERIKNG